MSLWAVSVLVTGNNVSRHTAVVVEAASRAEAVGVGVMIGGDLFQQKDGWSTPHVIVHPVSDVCRVGHVTATPCGY